MHGSIGNFRLNGHYRTQSQVKVGQKMGRVSFNNYEVRYRKELGLVLKGVTCEINPGEKVSLTFIIGSILATSYDTKH